MYTSRDTRYRSQYLQANVGVELKGVRTELKGAEGGY